MQTIESELLKIGGIVLAGGKSNRFGRDKALEPFQGKTLIENVIDKLEKIVSDILIITNNPKQFQFISYPKFKDIIPNRGPLGGIYAGLTYSKYYQNIVVACDMPFISVECLEYLVQHANGYDVVVPYHDDDLLEPLCAIYSQSCTPFIESQLHAHNNQIFQFYDQVRTKRLLFSDHLPLYQKNLFYNINYVRDLRKLTQKK